MNEFAHLVPWPRDHVPPTDRKQSPAGEAASARAAGARYFQWVTLVAPPARVSSSSLNQDYVEAVPERSQRETLALIESQGWSLFSKSVTGGARAAGAAEAASWPDCHQAGAFAAARVIFSFRINRSVAPMFLADVDAYEPAPALPSC